MTSNKDSETPRDSANTPSGSDSSADASDNWQSFLDSHDADLSDVENSRTARKFERHARKEEERAEKQRVVDARDLTADSFAASSRKKPRWSWGKKRSNDDFANAFGTSSDSDNPGHNTGSGPRDFQSSWLDVDDDLGSDFTPGPENSNVGSMKKSTVTFAIITVLGVLGLVLVLFVPQIAGLLGTIAGVLTLIGAAGLFMQLRGHSETRSNPFDDGARV
ncbi:MAG: hypothetical protein LKJ47_05450 [Bifidobacteriaceae bacterium]|jgi:hypothetical protein|nr:hypothetical protein [Bifidobacteriaceae bacterium]